MSSYDDQMWRERLEHADNDRRATEQDLFRRSDELRACQQRLRVAYFNEADLREENSLLKRLVMVLKAMLWDNNINWELELMKYADKNMLEDLLTAWRKAHENTLPPWVTQIRESEDGESEP